MNDKDLRETEEKLQRYYQLRHIRTTLENLIGISETGAITAVIAGKGADWRHESLELTAVIVAQLKIELARTIAEMEAM